MKRVSLIPTLLIAGAVMIFTSCGDNSKPGWEYMPDMAHAVSYETYTENPNFGDDMTNRAPVKGSIPLYQGVVGNLNHYKPFHYSNTVAGYDSAGLYVHNPIERTPEVLAEGKRLYGIYCSPCHGFSGKSDGPIVVNDKIKNTFPPPPNYFTADNINMPEGKMYHIVHYGKNMMGSYASQLDQQQVWSVLHYVRSMQQNYSDSLKAVGTVTASADTTKKK